MPPQPGEVIVWVRRPDRVYAGVTRASDRLVPRYRRSYYEPTEADVLEEDISDARKRAAKLFDEIEELLDDAAAKPGVKKHLEEAANAVDDAVALLKKAEGEASA